MKKRMKHCVFNSTLREEKEIKVAKEVAWCFKFDLLGEYEGSEIEILESDYETEIYITSDNLCTLINMCMEFAREEEARKRMCDLYLD